MANQTLKLQPGLTVLIFATVRTQDLQGAQLGPLKKPSGMVFETLHLLLPCTLPALALKSSTAQISDTVFFT